MTEQYDWKEASPENLKQEEIDGPEHWKPRRDGSDVKWPKLVGEHPGDWDEESVT